MLRLKEIVLAAAAGLGLLAAPANAATIIGGTTSVTVSSIADIAALGLTLAPTGSATATVAGGIPTVDFPITSGMVDDGTGAALIQHDGSGLLVSGGGNSLLLENFLIDTAALTLSGRATANGALVGVVPVFSIDSGLQLSLTSQAAGALTSVFGAPDLTGFVIGTAATSPVTAPVPEPSAWATMIAGFALIGGALRARRTWARAMA